jgi:adenylate cyclase
VAKPVDWDALLVNGHEPLKVSQRIFRRLPHDPRCKLCLNPFGGVAGKLIGLLGHRPSRKNPHICQFCFDRLPTGGIEIDIGVVFADVRSSTAMGEQLDPTTFAKRLNEFYGTATKVLIRNEGHCGQADRRRGHGSVHSGHCGPRVSTQDRNCGT